MYISRRHHAHGQLLIYVIITSIATGKGSQWLMSVERPPLPPNDSCDYHHSYCNRNTTARGGEVRTVRRRGLASHAARTGKFGTPLLATLLLRMGAVFVGRGTERDGQEGSAGQTVAYVCAGVCMDGGEILQGHIRACTQRPHHRLYVGASWKRPIRATIIKSPESCQHDARHASRNVVPGDAIDLRSCPSVVQELSNSCCCKVYQVWAMSANYWPMLANVYRTLATAYIGRFGLFRPELWPTSGQILQIPNIPNSGRLGPHLAQVGQLLVKVTRTSAKLARLSPYFAKHQPSLAHTSHFWPMLPKLWSNLAELGHFLAYIGQVGLTLGRISALGALARHLWGNVSVTVGDKCGSRRDRRGVAIRDAWRAILRQPLRI